MSHRHRWNEMMHNFIYRVSQMVALRSSNDLYMIPLEFLKLQSHCWHAEAGNTVSTDDTEDLKATRANSPI